MEGSNVRSDANGKSGPIKVFADFIIRYKWLVVLASILASLFLMSDCVYNGMLPNSYRPTVYLVIVIAF